jgi:sigma-E factor negative regulatory protein RseC
MSSSVDCIAKEGFIDHIDDRKIYVRIMSVSACASCHANGSCNSSESAEKLIGIDRDGAPEVEPGQKVRISMNATNGNLAVVYGYVVPLLILVVALLVLVNFTSEGIAGLLSIAMLAPYYAGVYMLRKHFERRFRFTIE